MSTTLPPQLAAPATAPTTIWTRSFVGLLVAQFFAAFNDQAIHAAAMFFVINTQTLSEQNAISLMPILFYAPWPIFCTVAGYCADRYSKRRSLVTWKVVEVGITTLAAVGFYLGRQGDPTTVWPLVGSACVLACVFLMGLHSAFFVPAKYGIMPQLLPPEQLSRGNGVLESLSFIAIILGTVGGGVMSYLFLRQELYIGLVLIALALIGAVASLAIERVPASNPGRAFPKYIYGPLVSNIRTLWSSHALRLALLGLVFFTFVVSFMRAAVYMLGESQNPRWDELKTSMVVGTVALGVGVSSPLAGYLSGKRIEVRLVLVGAAGMTALLFLAGLFAHTVPALVLCIVGIGFFTGFYIVPLYTLLQHRAPKASKGDMIATSNCVNTVGAIAATLLFKGVVLLALVLGLTPVVGRGKGQTPEIVGRGTLKEVEFAEGQPGAVTILKEGGEPERFGRRLDPAKRGFGTIYRRVTGTNPNATVLRLDPDVPLKPGLTPQVVVWRYFVDTVTYYEVELVELGEQTPPDHRDYRELPRFLFAGAGVLALLMLVGIARPVLRVRRELIAD